MLVWPKIVEHYKTKKLFSYIEMGKEILTLGMTYWNKKNKFNCHKTNFLGDADIEKVLISNKISFGKKKNCK